MKIIAFTGVANTGKTTALEVMEKILKKDHPELRYKILGENAMKYISQHGWHTVDRNALQNRNGREEQKRLDTLLARRQQKKYDVVIVDRTYVDGVIYTMRNTLLELNVSNEVYITDRKYIQLSKKLYDTVIYFHTPILQDMIMQETNHPSFNKIFWASISLHYEEKLIEFANCIAFEKQLGQLKLW